MKYILYFILMPGLIFSACATLPDKKEVAVDKIKFAYSVKGIGSPTVVFESGLGAGMDSWSPVFEKSSEFTTVFAYDRRGYGESGKAAGSRKSSAGDEVVKTAGGLVLDAVAPVVSTAITLGSIAASASGDSSPRTGAEVVAELHEVLKNAGIQPPYILVGHSLGGLYMMLYARTYPDEIDGLMLVDSMHPEQIKRCKEFLPAKECDPEYYPWWVKTLIKISPSVIKAEMSGMTETGMQVLATGASDSFPLIVISHGNPPADEPGMGQMWASLQQDLVDQSSHGTHIIAKESGHNIQGDEPELVIQTIRDFVMQARQGAGDLPIGEDEK